MPIVKGLGRTLGKHYEIVLHDISQSESSVIAIENGHITKRKVGSPVTDFLLELLSLNKENGKDMALNYISKTKDGKRLKSSTILIKDENGKVIGCLCINLDLTAIEVSKKFLDEISKVEHENSTESFLEDVEDFLEVMIHKGLSIVDKPANLLTKDEKIKIVEYLKNKHVFNIKGAVDAVAKELNVSRYTVYNYIDEINSKDIYK
ncbi:helix-turn-helix transcriptional regulator [Thermohalobacter berrensis]|uniref:helix-turn-helix transcriptional regulator n=1 Tax=Thermohalobacter berrensis TaxID=99594 RepID=UPI00243057A3|nr:PAS domain-containing protein [Thermohalobacter berrensis]